jgi:hypothetical protein
LSERRTGHEAGQIGLAPNHLRRRNPVGPFGLARDLQQAGPLEAVPTDADAVAQRPVVALDDVEVTLRGDNDDRAGRLGGAIEDGLFAQRRGKLDRAGLVTRLFVDFLHLLGARERIYRKRKRRDQEREKSRSI